MRKPGISNIEKFVIEKVKEKRRKLNLSQAQLAYQLEVSEGFIGNIERVTHRAKYSIHHLNELAKIFKCSPRDFLPKDAI